MNTLSNVVLLLEYVIGLIYLFKMNLGAKSIQKLVSHSTDELLALLNKQNSRTITSRSVSSITEQVLSHDAYSLTGTLAKIPLTGSVLVNESKPPLRDLRRYLTGSTVTESRPNTKPNSVIDTEGEPNE